MWRSEPQMPALATRTRTPSPAGAGSSTTSTDFPHERTARMARKVGPAAAQCSGAR